MQQFCPPQGTKVCYNALVPRKRDATILDIGLETRVSAGLGISFPGYRPEVAAGARVMRDHARGKGQAQQRIGVSGETTTFTDEAKIRCCAAWVPTRRNLLSFVSSRLVVVPPGNNVSRVRRSFYVPRRRYLDGSAQVNFRKEQKDELRIQVPAMWADS